MFSLLLSLADYVIPTVSAQCPFVGVDCSVTFTLSIFIFNAAFILIEIASGLSIVFVVMGGAFLVFNGGNDSLIEKGKKAILYALIGYTLAILSQAIISFVVARTEFISPDSPHLTIMREVVATMLLLFNGVFALMMLYYGFKLVLARGQQSELDSVKKGLTWTVIGAFAVNLAYALISATVNLIL